MKTWVVVSSRTEAKIFSYGNTKMSVVEFVNKIENPKGRLRPQEINADKPGIFSSRNSHGTKLVKPQSPIERVAQEFAKVVADYLEDSRQKKEFDQLVIIADPHFMGRIRSASSKALRHCIIKEINKDLGAVTCDEIKNRLWPEVSTSVSI